MKKSEVQKILDYWIKILHLSNWKVKLYLTSIKKIKEYFEGKKEIDEFAGIEIEDLEKKADLYIYKGLKRERMEQDIVHELLHIIIIDFEYKAIRYRRKRLTKEEKEDINDSIELLINHMRDVLIDMKGKK